VPNHDKPVQRENPDQPSLPYQLLQGAFGFGFVVLIDPEKIG
jgi:hypothetical protein